MPSAIITQVAASVPFDNTTGKGYQGTDCQAAFEELRDHTIYISRTQAVATNGTLTLTVSDKTMQFLTGAGTGTSVQMPSATTLTLSAFYIIVNTTSNNVLIKDGSGATLFTLGGTTIGYLYLQLNGTTAGTWIYWQQVTGISSIVPIYKITSATPFATSANVDTPITGMTITPVAGTYAIWYSCSSQGSGSGQHMDTTIYNGASAITDSKRIDLTPSGTHDFATQTLTTNVFNGTNACSVDVNANGNSITVNQRTLLLIRLGV